MLKSAARITIAGTSALGAAVLFERNSLGSDNFDRSVSFYRVAIPGYIIYKATDWLTRSCTLEVLSTSTIKMNSKVVVVALTFVVQEREVRFAALHAEWAPRALAKILELRGFYIKVSNIIFVRHVLDFLNGSYKSRNIFQVGQMAASNVGNAFPDIWVRTMEVGTTWGRVLLLSFMATRVGFAGWRPP